MDVEEPFPIILKREGEYHPDKVIVRDDPTDGKTYIRTGGCTVGCGACCEFVVLPVDPRAMNTKGFEDWKNWLALHRIMVRSHGTGPRRGLEARIPLACIKLADGACGATDEERPKMCGDYPEIPHDVMAYGLKDTCTYEFTEVEE